MMAFGKVFLVTIFLVLCTFSACNGQREVATFTESNWTDMLEDEWMVEFYAPWCPACKALQGVWKQFAAVAPTLKIKVGQVDVTASPGLSGRFMVTALPTIFHVLNGEFRQYKGSRDEESFIAFIKEKKWQQVDPVPGWKAPNSIQMTVVSAFFKLSQTLRIIHNKLMEEFGLPSWGSYLLFAIATIILGALLGLIMVCFIDLVYPPKKYVAKSVKGAKKKDKVSDDELDDEDIRDDLVDDANESRSDTDSEKKVTKSNPNSPKAKKRKVRRAE